MSSRLPRAFVSVAAFVTAAAFVSCSSSTAPGNNCDSGAGFNIFLANRSIEILRPGVAIRDIEIRRDTAQGPVQLDILRGVRRYGSGAFLDTLGLSVIFTPNPSNGVTTRLELQHIGSDLQTYTDEPLALRAFIGSGATAKECYREIFVTVD